LGHPNQFFATVICNLQQAFELFGNVSWVFQNSLNPGTSGGRWSVSFSGFQVRTTFTPDHVIKSFFIVF